MAISTVNIVYCSLFLLVSIIGTIQFLLEEDLAVPMQNKKNSTNRPYEGDSKNLHLTKEHYHQWKCILNQRWRRYLKKITKTEKINKTRD